MHPIERRPDLRQSDPHQHVQLRPWGQAIGGSGSAYNPFQYTATYNDAPTGLYQMGARYYQPASGRFTQLDPHPGQLLTVNRFAYVGCNPTNYTDPTGLWSEAALAAWGCAAAVVGVATTGEILLEALILAAVGLLATGIGAVVIAITLGSFIVAAALAYPLACVEVWNHI